MLYYPEGIGFPSINGNQWRKIYSIFSALQNLALHLLSKHSECCSLHDELGQLYFLSGGIWNYYDKRGRKEGDGERVLSTAVSM